MPFKSEDIAYFAGLFEGEGTVRVDGFYWVKGQRRIRRTPQVKIRIGMTDIEPLERVQQTIGGRINGPYQDKGHQWKPYYLLDIDSPKLMRELVPAIWPLLSPRRRAQFGEGWF